MNEVLPIEAVLSFIVECLLLLRLSFIYQAHFKAHPILTTMITSSLLNAISDTISQTVTILRERRRNVDRDKEARLDSLREQFELHPSTSLEMLRGSRRQFEFERLMRFTSFGFLSSIMQFSWFSWLDAMFPVTYNLGIIKRVLADQLVYAPVSLLLFFAYMNLMEGNNLADFKKRMKKGYVTSLKANYLLWPVIQVINFKFVPLMYQLPMVSSINVGWNIYLLGKV